MCFLIRSIFWIKKIIQFSCEKFNIASFELKIIMIILNFFRKIFAEFTKVRYVYLLELGYINEHYGG